VSFVTSVGRPVFSAGAFGWVAGTFGCVLGTFGSSAGRSHPKEKHITDTAARRANRDVEIIWRSPFLVK